MIIDNILENMIYDKRVAIVGPSEHLCYEIEDTHGSYIDSFDIVIRLNDFFKLPKEYEKFYGTKYNIISSSFWHRANEDFDDRETFWKSTNYCSEEGYINLKEKTLLLEPYARNEFMDIYNKYKSTINSKNLFYGRISPEKFFQVWNLLRKYYPIDKTPSTGLLTIGLILSCNPKELYVCGITSYQSMKYMAHFKGYNKFHSDSKFWPKNGYNGKNLIDKDGKESSKAHHNFSGESKIIKMLIESNIINVDKYMKKLFNEF